jgi:hypothetical protein
MPPENYFRILRPHAWKKPPSEIDQSGTVIPILAAAKVKIKINLQRYGLPR